MSSNNTANDLFLRAEYQANQGQLRFDLATFMAAIPLYRQAIAKAPTFALAYAKLAVVECDTAAFGGGGLDVKQLNADARLHVEQALKVAPNLPAAHLALASCDIFSGVDLSGALQAINAALALRPNDTEALEARGRVEVGLGRFDDALASSQQAFVSDPRNSLLATFTGYTYAKVARYPEAERWYQRAQALDPLNVNARVDLAAAILYSTGDVSRALAEAQGNERLIKFTRVRLLTYQRKYQEALSLLDTVPDTPTNFGDTVKGPKALQQAELFRLLGNVDQARLHYTQALPKIRAQLAQAQGFLQVSGWLNLAQVELGLGHTTQGLAAIAKVLDIVATGRDPGSGPGFMETCAALYAEAQRPDRAVPLLVKALARPGIGGSYSPVLLWLDPAWDPIRQKPRFQALLKKYAQYKPSVIPAASAAASDETGQS